ncbi:hypothetical protein HN695_03895 [Candidatus Woesearchaeota archaeon]|jgi:hypothetical protein|nr:hypothetical protein [Candidatus Woesearchaeota archaeon]MBT5272292.1 hypothetical protein [Candidatus Woesearchaeota archaeon]MBT6040621.1 hypothetical protein [Candidatus Woesearchaeota archaeon]MBT6336564.1 hypothetical protein [Candidatus Woesearchaeota archaeon]MBT7927454.1 hypothetical protein [Candidatus Woesearchaeota archaeon]
MSTYTSPIGSTDPSPLREYTSHGNGMSANYGASPTRYEAGGAVRLHSSVLPGQDPMAKTGNLYRKDNFGSTGKKYLPNNGNTALYSAGTKNPIKENMYVNMLLTSNR